MICKLSPSRKKPGGAGGILHIKFQPFAPPPNSHCKHHKEPPQIDANLAFDCDRRSCIWPLDPPLPWHPPRSATPPGSAAERPWHASGRLGRRAPSAAAQERVANPGSRAHGPGSSSSAPPGSSGSSQHHRAHAVVVGKACGLPEGHGRPSGCPLADSGPALPSHLPRVCPSGLRCWLLLLLLLLAAAAGAHHVRRGGTCGPAAPYSPSLIRLWHPAGAADILWARAAGRGCTATTLPHHPTCPPPPPNPPPTHVLGQPLRSR